MSKDNFPPSRDHGRNPDGPRGLQARAAQSRAAQGNPAPGKPAQGRSTQGRPTQGRPAQGRPTQGRPAQGRPAAARAAAARAGQAGGTITARRRKKQSLSSPAFRRTLLKSFAAFVVLSVLVPLIAFATAYAVTKVPEPEELVNNQISYVLASDSSTELARIVPPEGNRQNVQLSAIPVPVRQAVLAAEDRNFYTNPGFSITGFGRAAVGQLIGRSSAGGGSTITQQYVKNALVGNDVSLVRKAKELVISAKMAREWSKDEILQAYLNTIYFGRNAYGIGAAARAYFNKDVSQLTPEEGAVLAAAIQAPSQLDPWTNRGPAEARWNYVMDGMVTINALSQADRLNARYPQVQDPALAQRSSVAEGTNGLIKQRVMDELSAAGITEEQVNTGGLRITTTIDPKAQAAAVEQIRTNFPKYPQDLLGAVVSIDPRSGGVRAYYGGDDPVGWDHANAGLQTGSTFKIFALAAYLDQGGSVYDVFDSSPVATGDATVTNAEGESCGRCSIAEALKRSLNTSFIRLTKQLENGPQDVADMAHRLGVATEIPGLGKTLSEPNSPPFEGITLGMYPSRPLDMASALATLANEGKYYRPHFVQKVENSNGEVLLDAGNPKPEQVVSPEVANAVISAMGPIAAYSNGNGLAGGRVSAAKTGTAQLGDTGQNKDAWMIGATPQLATAVWIGAPNGGPIRNQWGGIMYGSNLPATIWKNTMDQALENTEFETFAVPPVKSSYSSGSGSSSSSGSGSSSSSASSGGAGAGGGGGGASAANPAPAPAPAPPAPAPAPPAQPNGIDQFLNDLLGR